MTMISTDDQNAVALVRRGYDEPTRVLHFRVAFQATAAALDALRAIGDYNEFNGDRVARALYGSLPGREAPCLRVDVGRENSPVLYIRGLHAEHVDAVKAALYEAGVEELGIGPLGLLRAWWD